MFQKKIELLLFLLFSIINITKPSSQTNSNLKQMSSEQVIMESQNLNSITFIESESMPAEVTNRSNGRRIGFLRRKIVELQEELDTLLALEPVKVSKNVKGRPKSVKKLSPQQEADDDLFANLVDEMWKETTPDVKKFNTNALAEK